MSAETLRRAAALMRERAEPVAPSPWKAVEGASGQWWVECPHTADVALGLHEGHAEHIASWHPAVALAVADWLDAEADALDARNAAGEGRPRFTWHHAIAVANAYLDEEDR